MKRGYLYIEICISDSWVLPEPLLKNPLFRHPKYHKDSEPEFSPQSRYLPGDDVISNALLKAAGERGLPPDISPELLEYYNQTRKAIKTFGKSWMTAQEVEDYITNHPEDHDFYLKPDWFAKYGKPKEVRAVFWFADLG